MGRFEYAVQERQNSGGQLVVGYFRSHTRKGLSLDAEDVSFLDARFSEPFHIALLVRPYATKASTAGVFIREGGALHGDASYLEFPFRSSQLSSFRPSPLLAETAPPPPAAAPSSSAGTPLPAAPKSTARAQIVPIASRREISLPAPPPVADQPAKESAPAAPAAKPEEEASAAPAAPAETPIPVVNEVVKEAIPEKEEVEAVKQKDKEPETAVAVVEKPGVPVVKEEPKKSTPAPVAPAVEPVKEEKSKFGMVAGIVTAIALILVSLFVYPGFLKHGSIPTSGQNSGLSLSTERTGADILVTWNRDSDAVRNATRAVLFIFDGDRHETYEMDLGQLRDGKIMYSPITADVSFRMDVTPRGKSTPITDSVRVLRTRPSPMGDDTQGQPGAAKPAATPATPAAAKPNTPETSSTEPTPVEDTKPAVSVSPTKPFDASSLVQRLRPAPANDVLEAPSINPGVGSAGTPNAITGLNLNSATPAPAAPVAPSTPARKTTPSVAGGQIVQAELVFRKEPEYPKLARQMGVKGIVELTATIGTDGKVKGVKVEKGHPLLTKAASDAVMQWVYRPTLLNGQPVQNDTRITLNFMGER